MFWILLLSALTHLLYCKYKKTNWTRKKMFKKDSEYDLKFPFVQNVYVQDEYYPLVIHKDKTYFVSNQKSKFGIKTISTSEI